jgi:hypothetical protein
MYRYIYIHISVHIVQVIYIYALSLNHFSTAWESTAQRYLFKQSRNWFIVQSISPWDASKNINSRTFNGKLYPILINNSIIFSLDLYSSKAVWGIFRFEWRGGHIRSWAGTSSYSKKFKGIVRGETKKEKPRRTV